MTDEKTSEHIYISLLAFFPAKLLSITFYSVGILTGLFAIFWPWGKDLPDFFQKHQGPALSFPVFAAAVVIYSYIQLRCGRGELVQRSQGRRLLTQACIQELEQRFFRYGSPMLVLHTAFFLLPFFPPLILAASVSGLSQQSLLLAIGLLWVSGLLFRAGGLLLYRLLGTASTLGYFLGWVFFGLFFFVLPIYLPYLSPLRVLYNVHKNQDFMSGTIALHTAYWLCLGAMSVMTVILLLAAHVVEARATRKEAEEQE